MTLAEARTQFHSSPETTLLLQGPEMHGVVAFAAASSSSSSSSSRPVLDPGLRGPLFWSYLFTLPIFTLVAAFSNFLIFSMFNCRKFQRYRSSIYFRYVAGVDICQALVLFGLMWFAVLVPDLSTAPAAVDAYCRLYTILRTTVQDLSAWGVVCLMIDRCCFATNRVSKTPVCYVVTMFRRQWVFRHMHARVILISMTLVIFSVNIAMVMGSVHQEHATSGLDCFITWKAMSDFSPKSLAALNVFISCICPLVLIVAAYLTLRNYVPPSERSGSGIVSDLSGPLRASAYHVARLGRHLRNVLTCCFRARGSPCASASDGVGSRTGQTQTGRSESTTTTTTTTSSFPDTCPSAQLLLPCSGAVPIPLPPPSAAAAAAAAAPPSAAARPGNLHNHQSAGAARSDSQNNNNVRPLDAPLLAVRHQGVTLGPDDVTLRAMVERTCRYLGNWRLDRLYSSFKRKEVVLSVVAVKDPRLACKPPSYIDRNFNAMAIVHGLFFVLLIQPQLWFLVTGVVFGTAKDWCLLQHVGLAADLLSNNRINFTLFLYIMVSGNALASPLAHSLRRLRRICCRCFPPAAAAAPTAADTEEGGGAAPLCAPAAGILGRPLSLAIPESCATTTTTAAAAARFHEYHYPTCQPSSGLPLNPRPPPPLPPPRARGPPATLQLLLPTGARGRRPPHLPLPPRTYGPQTTQAHPPRVALKDVSLVIDADLGQGAAGGQGDGVEEGTVVY